MMVRLVKVILLLSIVIFLILNIFKTISIDKHIYEKQLNITIKSEEFNEKELIIVQGTTFGDILDELGIDKLSYSGQYDINEPLYDGQILNFNQSRENYLISINSDDKNLLCTLPGIGEKTALKIIEYRNIYGNFKYLEELKNVSGIGDKKFEILKNYICL